MVDGWLSGPRLHHGLLRPVEGAQEFGEGRLGHGHCPLRCVDHPPHPRSHSSGGPEGHLLLSDTRLHQALGPSRWFL